MHAVSASSFCPPPAAMLLLLLLVLPFSQGEELKTPALHEEFNVLVYGTLQLSQALGDTYSSTTDKLQRVVGRQGKLEKKMERLRAEVSRTGQETRQIGEEIERLQREEQEMRSVSHRAAEDVQDAQKEYTELRSRVHRLETGLGAKEHRLPDLKERVKQQNFILQVITEESARQKRQMAEQRTRLLTILKQASAIG
ncbi:angiopoietin-like protein 8 [Dendropsophus ebraccatus]|uniref:angiopoietin-like protein 8 n=1 Tax=Dendropsophus ebraccatus TaxID=150705 RepID=UPI00383131EF